MTRVPLPMHPHRKKLINDVRIEFRRVKKEIAPHLVGQPEEMVNVQVAQNVLRDCLNAALHDMLPYSQMTLIELATRLASYAISAAPLEDQDIMVSGFLAGFADAHMERTAGGQVIRSDWRMDDGREIPNYPS